MSRDQTFLHGIVYCSQIEKEEFLKLDFLKVGFYTADCNYMPLYYESGYYMELGDLLFRQMRLVLIKIFFSFCFSFFYHIVFIFD